MCGGRAGLPLGLAARVTSSSETGGGDVSSEAKARAEGASRRTHAGSQQPREKEVVRGQLTGAEDAGTERRYHGQWGVAIAIAMTVARPVD